MRGVAQHLIEKKDTVKPLLTDTSIIRTPLYYGQFVLSQKCQKSYIPYLYNTATSVKRTLSSVPLVSVLKRFDCMPENMNKVERNTLSLWIICCHFQSSVAGSDSACEEQLHPSRKIAWLSMQSAHQTDANTVFTYILTLLCLVSSGQKSPDMTRVVPHFSAANVPQDTNFSYLLVVLISFLAFRGLYFLGKATFTLPPGLSSKKEWLYLNTLISFIHACISSVWSIFW